MSLSVASGETSMIKLPRSQHEWHSILETACVEPKGWQWEQAGKLLERFQLHECLCMVHPECRLIQHLETKHGRSWDHIPPFNHIGVSRPICNSCRIWIHAFNQLGGPRFYPKGLIGRKWTWPWAMPMIKKSESLWQEMEQIISNYYVKYQTIAGTALSDDKTERSGSQDEISLGEPVRGQQGLSKYFRLVTKPNRAGLSMLNQMAQSIPVKRTFNQIS